MTIFDFMREFPFLLGGQSNSVILSFLLMMVVNPEVQKKAQAQIDTVVGGNRLPMIEDRASLPYIDAVLRETLRYSSVVPLCKYRHWIYSLVDPCPHQQSHTLSWTTISTLDTAFRKVGEPHSTQLLNVHPYLQELRSYPTFGEPALSL